MNTTSKSKPHAGAGGSAPRPPGFCAILPPRVLSTAGAADLRSGPGDRGTGPAVGARVASLHCPILRCGQHQIRRSMEHYQAVIVVDREK